MAQTRIQEVTTVTESQPVTTVIEETPVTTTVVRQTPVDAASTTKRYVTPGAAPVVVDHPQAVYDAKKAIFRTYQMIWYVLGVVETLLVLRLLLQVLGANPNSGFAVFIYTISSLFSAPFVGLLGSSSNGQGVIEWGTFIEMLFYVLLAYGLVQLFQLMKPTTPHEVEQTVDS